MILSGLVSGMLPSCVACLTVCSLGSCLGLLLFVLDAGASSGGGGGNSMLPLPSRGDRGVGGGGGLSSSSWHEGFMDKLLTGGWTVDDLGDVL